MNTYEKILDSRIDMSNWLIHFTRPSATQSARERLRDILLTGVLRPSWSNRTKGRTVYGPSPAVCFTEQPLWAFARYLSARNDQKISGYGVLIHKHDVFAAGGRPVVYGLQSARDAKPTAHGLPVECRILEPDDLPLREQYRYVTFVPRPTDPIDWSHEREWRWRPPDGGGEPVVDGGLGIGGPSTYFASRRWWRAHVLVERRDDIAWLQAELAGQMGPADPCAFDYPPRWSYRLQNEVGVVALEAVVNDAKTYRRLEEWPGDEPIPIAANPSLQVPARDLFTRE